MCGIAGSFLRRPDANLSRTLLEMAGELAHRGPDGTGLYLDAGGRFGMANTRLAIVDPEGGEQPIGDESGRYWVMQNGEIYNYVELREQLAGLGYRFATSCDTEVIANAFAEWGTACLERFNGDFAIAIWDAKERELFLARDRFGVRPLFLFERDGGLLFASEIKALLRHPSTTRELDPRGLVESFVLWSISPERSAFRGVGELPPAHFLRLRADGRRTMRRWWDFELCRGAGVESNMDRDRRDELAEELAFLLEDSVRLRLRADVEVGGYLSGGLDSSITAALASRTLGGGLVAFGIGFEDERFDERRYQEQIACELGTELHRASVGVREIGELYPRAVLLAEQPSLRTALVPMLSLSALVRAHPLKVVLTGEGADELFAGYDIFREAKLRRFWARDSESRLRPLLFGRIHRYLLRDLAASGDIGRRFFARGLEDTDDPLYSHRLRFRSSERILRLFSDEALADALSEQAGPPERSLERRLPADFSSFTPLGQAQYLEIASFFEGYLLHAQGDRMLMGNSVEGRFPYLDYRVAEFAARLGDSAKLRGLREKDILRRAAADFLPPEIGSRIKRPYRAPILRAFAGPEAPEYVSELLEPARVKESGVLSAAVAGQVLRKCRENSDRGVGEIDEMALAGVLSVMLLHEQLVADPATATPVKPGRVVVGNAERELGAGAFEPAEAAAAAAASAETIPARGTAA